MCERLCFVKQLKMIHFYFLVEVIDELEFNEQPVSACMRLFYLGSGMAL